MPFKKIKRAFKKVTKPIAKVLDKVVPNEIKPFLPYAAAVAPYLLPAGIAGGSGIGALLRRGALTGGLNLGAQLSQEGSEGDFSALSLGLAGLQGALTAPGAAETFQGMTTAGSPEYLQLGEQATLADAAGNIDLASSALGDQATMLADRGLLTKAADFGLGSLSKGAEALDTVMTAGKQNPFSMEGLKAASIPFTQGSADLGIATARKALKDYELELDAFNALAGEQREASDEARRSAIIASMTRADFTQDIIDETLDQLGLKDGGIARLGFNDGGFEPFKFTSKIPKVFKEDAFGDDALGQIMKMSYAIRAPIIDVVRTVAKTATEAAKLTAAIAKLGYDITEPVRDLAGAGLKVGGKGIMEAFKESEDATRFIQPMYYLERFGPEKNLTDDETRLARAKRSSRADDEDIRKLENRLFGFDDAGMNQRPEDRKISETIKLRERLGFDNGGDVDFGGIKEAIKGVAQNNMEEGVTQMYVSDSAGVIPLRDGDAVTGKTMDMMVSGFVEPYTKNDFRDPDGYERFMDIFSEFKETKMKKDKELNEEGMKKGGLASYKDGGIMNLGGKEMDMRTGGFIPIGAKERADDVPARLSKNEFVMTADAVRAAGGGSVNQGAKRMYDLMHNLEARA